MAQNFPSYTVVPGVPPDLVVTATTIEAKTQAEFAAQQQFVYKAIIFQLRPVTIGILRAELELLLARNAVVTSFPVVLTARVADSTPAASIGQLRSYYTQTAQSGLVTVIVDFGVPRTVAAISSPLTEFGVLGDSFTIQRVLTWTGAAFDQNNPAYLAPFIVGPFPADHEFQRTDVNPVAPSTYATTILSEVRTSKLQIDMITSLAPEAAAAELYLSLPDLPAQLALSIDDDPPVWTHGDVAAPRAPDDKTVTDTDWSGEGKRLVDLSDALNALTNDPEAPIEDVTFTLALTSGVPGVLDLAPGSSLDPAYLPHIRHLARMDVGAGGQRRLEFAAEGEQPITLTLPAWAEKIEQATLRMTAEIEPRRVLPAVGPERTEFAVLVLDPAHAVAAELTVTLEEPLVELSGVRIPLLAGPEGAEAQVILLTPGEEPGAPLEGAVSSPVEFAANAGGAEVWYEFTFDEPIATDPGKPAPWAALILSRGRLEWTLGMSERALRHGPPSGPWLRMPGVIDSRSELGARIRVVGRAEDDNPVAPISLQLRVTEESPDAASAEVASSAWVPLTPTAKGIIATLADTDLAVAPGQQVQLRVLSRTPTTVEIEDLDLTLKRG